MNVKKVLAIVLTFALILGICGCSCSSGNNSSSSNSTKTSTDIEYNPLDYVTLGQYEGVVVDLNKADYEVTDAKIADKMKEMCGGETSYEADPDKTVVKSDSIVNVDYVGSLNGTPFTGGTAKDVWIDVAKNADALKGTSYISGFSNGIVGARVGTKAVCDVTFPENYQSKDLAGKQVQFEFTINSIAKDSAADLTDEYVKSHSSYSSAAELKAAATSQLETELQQQKESDIKKKVTEIVVGNCKVNSLPKDYVEKTVDEYMAYYEKRYATGNTTLEQVIQNNYNQSLDEFKQQVKEEFESELKTQLVFEAIAADQKMTVDEEGFKNYCNKLMTDAGFDSLETFYKYQSPTGDAASAEKYLKKIYLCNKALDYCVSKAVINEK